MGSQATLFDHLARISLSRGARRFMTTQDPKSRSPIARSPSGPGAAEAIPPSGDPIARYQYVVNTAPLETIERATAEMLDALSPADGERIRNRLDHFPELRGVEPEEDSRAPVLLARFGARAEKRRPGALARAVRTGVSDRVGDELCSVLARAFVSTPAARAFLSEAADEGRSSQMEPESDADFSEEFGCESGYAGGSGFENVEFDRWI